jgi:hypothetical protein
VEGRNVYRRTMIIIFNVCQHPPPTPGPTHSATPGLLTSLGFAKRHFGPISFLAWHVGWPCASREQGAADILESRMKLALRLMFPSSIRMISANSCHASIIAVSNRRLITWSRHRFRYRFKRRLLQSIVLSLSLMLLQ